MQSTAEQVEKIASLKSQLFKEPGAWDPTKHDENALRRFLKARGWEVEAAKRMWLSSVTWRKQWDADTILETQVLTPQQEKRLLRLYPHGLHGIDAQGRPVLVYRIGATDVIALKNEFPEALLKRKHVQTYEHIMRVVLPACSAIAGRLIDQVTTVVDLEGMGLWDISKVKELLLPTMSMNGDNYPETLAQMIVINAPSMFDSAFNVIKRLLPPDTQKKIQIFGKNYRAELQMLIPKDQLMRVMGGTSTATLEDCAGPWNQQQLKQLTGATPTATVTHQAVHLAGSHEGMHAMLSEATRQALKAQQAAVLLQVVNQSKLSSSISIQAQSPVLSNTAGAVPSPPGLSSTAGAMPSPLVLLARLPATFSTASASYTPIQQQPQDLITSQHPITQSCAAYSQAQHMQFDHESHDPQLPYSEVISGSVQSPHAATMSSASASLVGHHNSLQDSVLDGLISGTDVQLADDSYYPLHLLSTPDSDTSTSMYSNAVSASHGVFSPTSCIQESVEESGTPSPPYPPSFASPPIARGQGGEQGRNLAAGLGVFGRAPTAQTLALLQEGFKDTYQQHKIMLRGGSGEDNEDAVSISASSFHTAISMSESTRVSVSGQGLPVQRSSLEAQGSSSGGGGGAAAAVAGYLTEASADSMEEARLMDAKSLSSSFGSARSMVFRSLPLPAADLTSIQRSIRTSVRRAAGGSRSPMTAALGLAAGGMTQQVGGMSNHIRPSIATINEDEVERWLLRGTTTTGGTLSWWQSLMRSWHRQGSTPSSGSGSTSSLVMIPGSGNNNHNQRYGLLTGGSRQEGWIRPLAITASSTTSDYHQVGSRQEGWIRPLAITASSTTSDYHQVGSRQEGWIRPLAITASSTTSDYHQVGSRQEGWIRPLAITASSTTSDYHQVGSSQQQGDFSGSGGGPAITTTTSGARGFMAAAAAAAAPSITAVDDHNNFSQGQSRGLFTHDLIAPAALLLDRDGQMQQPWAAAIYTREGPPGVSCIRMGSLAQAGAAGIQSAATTAPAAL
ncbi:hypothetical protein CEUSTIGMA_g9721.t1 [Chlamydomonas eustigma]|uniref:CRAL-TRIO domain-containing protein n=1 Tax=Chlamydomonas eustigma TaxID=1157962 RepID=A0A250XH93_9CHLO|nr:hypothetical protein CEUSTIGMA_g9721.t1 [Chlamydomonas eustigma]|eukprot:GAX82292.1 hypothetical protein CEUSTIGMA_g9721.t1 [Chlamydomonas eustigma]